MSLGLLVGAFVFKVFVENNCAEWWEFGNKFVYLTPIMGSKIGGIIPEQSSPTRSLSEKLK